MIKLDANMKWVSAYEKDYDGKTETKLIKTFTTPFTTKAGEDDPTLTKNPKKYAFIGFGCGITYFTYRKNNLKAKEIAERANTLLRGKISNMFLARFTHEEQKYYKNIGCPLLAIFSQDINIQQTYYSMVVKWAEENGVKMDYKSFLD
jgi:hypothetical protein